LDHQPKGQKSVHIIMYGVLWTWCWLDSKHNSTSLHAHIKMQVYIRDSHLICDANIRCVL